MDTVDSKAPLSGIQVVGLTFVAVLTVLSMLSMGGGFVLLPVLTPVHVWAARRCDAIGRVLWSVLPVLAAGMLAWAGAYVAFGETNPWIWLVPLGASAVAVFGMVRVTTTRAQSSVGY